MFYGAASRYSGLYILGKAIEGADHVSNLAGIIRVEALGDTSGIQPMRADNGQSASRSYALNGRVAEEGRPGIIVRDWKKVVIK